MRARLTLLLLALLNATIFSAIAQAAPPATASAPTAASSDEFIRFVPIGTDGGTLQAATQDYRNRAGQTVTLFAAVHVADARFYRALNEQFKRQDALLYEMVKPKDMPIGELHDPNRPTSWVSIVQRFMEVTLKLQYQLDGIDYDAPNFVHADLDAETFAAMQDERGESMTGLMLQAMLKELSDPDLNDDPTGGVGPLLLALNNPDKALGLKLMLARQFSKMDEMLAGMEGPDGSVLLTERNKAAMAVLKKELASGKKQIGIFYGAGHLRGMEKILTEQMGFTRVGEPTWRIAWDMTPKTATTIPAR